MKKLIIFSFFLLSNTLYAQEQVVNSSSCTKLNSPTQPFMLVLDRGQDVLPSIIDCMQKANVPAATFSAIGAVKDPTIAYFNFAKNSYVDKKLSGYYELIDFQGNLTSLHNKPQIHAHISLGDNNYHAIAGHFKSATVSATMEMTIIPFKHNIARKADIKLNANFIAAN